MLRSLSCIIIATTLSATAAADDVWVLQGNAVGASAGLVSDLWISDALFFNTNPSPALVRLLGVSNGSALTTDRELVLAGGRGTSLNREDKRWSPSSEAPLWITHLDVPTGVVVESRISIGLIPTFNGPPMNGVNRKISFPVFRALQPAGTPKIHLGTDLEVIPARNNVAVYNAGDAVAHAQVAVHQICDGRILDTRSFAIPANTIIQVAGLSTTTIGCTNTGAMYVYVAVTVDQPSLSWVSSLSNRDVVKVVWAVTSSSP